jgi:hypothetical protein
METATPPAGGRGRTGPLLRNFALALGTALACLLLGEAGFRTVLHFRPGYDYEMWRYAAEIKEPLGDPRLPFAHLPNRRGTYYGAEIRTNGFGFRSPEITAAKPPGTTRVVVLGDSFTLGWGVPDDRTVCRQLEGLLNAGGRRVEVVNLGVGNYNTVMEVELFKRRGLPLDPDVVVLMYYINDTEETPRLTAFSLLARHSYLLASLQDAWRRLALPRRGGDPLEAYYREIYRPDAPGRVAGSGALRELAELCRSRGIRLLAVNIPDLRRLRPYPFSFATDQVRQFAAANGVPFLDLLPTFSPHEERTLWVSSADPHMNAQASTLAAAEIARALVGGGLLEPRGTRP